MELKPSDGIVSTLYHYIWKRPDSSMSKFRINIPHTILFHEHSPAFWYFSNKNGEISKKYESGITTETICKKFTRKEKRTEVVAVYLSMKKEFNKMAFDFEDELFQPEGLGKIASVEYITKDALSNFKTHRKSLRLWNKMLGSRGFCRIQKQDKAWHFARVY